MSKRSGEALDQEKTLKSNDAALPTSNGNDQPANDLEMGEFEDPYGDDFESDGEIVEIDSAGENDDVDMDRPAENRIVEEKSGEIYLPHRSRPLGPDEVLEADPSVYEMLHNVHMPWPCLTLDILPDNLGMERRSYPATMYVATATQAEKSRNNELIMMKLSSLAKTLVKNEDEDDEDDDDENYDVDPVLESETIPLKDTTNRLRVSPHAKTTGEYFAATMNESGEANIFDLSPQFKAFDSPGYMIPKTARRALHTIRSHGNVEGYGLDWSPLISTGALLTGDISGRVYFTQRTSGSKWVTDKTAFQGSEASIEEIQWSPNEKTVFATGDCDGFIRIWDTRSKKHKPAINVQASSSDVNVLSWCNKIDYLLASGHDDGSWGVWDLRNFKNKESISPVVNYDFHKSPITSISFNPLDESIVAVSSEDNTVTLWDLAVEADDEEIQQEKTKYKEMQEIPPQLLFVHWQKEVKDVRWHPQIPGALVSTGTDGLNVWKTISV